MIKRKIFQRKLDYTTFYATFDLLISETNGNTYINQVWIRDSMDHHHPLLDPVEISGIRVREVKYGYRRHWNGWSLNPSLRRMSDLKKFFPNGLSEIKDEIDQAIHLSKFNYKAVSLVESSIKHIGYGRRSINFRA